MNRVCLPSSVSVQNPLHGIGVHAQRWPRRCYSSTLLLLLGYVVDSCEEIMRTQLYNAFRGPPKPNLTPEHNRPTSRRRTSANIYMSYASFHATVDAPYPALRQFMFVLSLWRSDTSISSFSRTIQYDLRVWTSRLRSTSSKLDTSQHNNWECYAPYGLWRGSAAAYVAVRFLHTKEEYWNSMCWSRHHGGTMWASAPT